MGNPPRDNGLKAPPPLTDNRICVLMNAASGKDDKSEQAERMQEEARRASALDSLQRARACAKEQGFLLN